VTDFATGTTRYYMDRIKVHQKSTAAPELFQSAELTLAWIERCAEQDAYAFRRMFSLAGQQKTKTVSFPANWWQHFKQRWFPAWALDRWPVRLRTVNFHAVRVFDGIPAPVGDLAVYYSQEISARG
jgi:hypothetical protein